MIEVGDIISSKHTVGSGKEMKFTGMVISITNDHCDIRSNEDENHTYEDWPLGACKKIKSWRLNK